MKLPEILGWGRQGRLGGKGVYYQTWHTCSALTTGWSRRADAKGCPLTSTHLRSLPLTHNKFKNVMKMKLGAKDALFPCCLPVWSPDSLCYPEHSH